MLDVLIGISKFYSRIGAKEDAVAAYEAIIAKPKVASGWWWRWWQVFFFGGLCKGLGWWWGHRSSSYFDYS